MKARKTTRPPLAPIDADGTIQKRAASTLREQTAGRSDDTQTPVFSRAELVGKFPEIKHQPAPKATRYRLSEEVRNQLVRRMALK